ncbi:MAG TPA: PepSY domain-containing protein [Steroidobacteraceae bacterium]
MKAFRTPLIAAAALVLSGAVLMAHAYAAPAVPGQAFLARASAQRSGLSLDQAVRLAQHRYRARVVRAETQTQGGRTIYVLRMLDEAGRVFAVRVDAASGTFL